MLSSSKAARLQELAIILTFKTSLRDMILKNLSREPKIAAIGIYSRHIDNKFVIADSTSQANQQLGAAFEAFLG